MYQYKTPLGGYEIDINDRTLCLTIHGVIELELALRFMLHAKILISSLPTNHWASLVDLSEWGLHPPEIVEFIEGFELWAQENGQLAEAAIVNESVLKIMAREKLVEKARKTVHQEYFKSKPEAQEWLRVLSLYK
jgi:hypothetical protein